MEGALGDEEVPATLDALRDLPSLRHLALRGVMPDADGLAALLADPVVARLETLDLWNGGTPIGPDALLAVRGACDHLRRLVVPGTQLDAGVRARFADWPELTFAGYFRQEILAFEIEFYGWPDGSR